MPTKLATGSAENAIRTAIGPLLKNSDDQLKLEAILAIKTPFEAIMKAVTSLVIGVRNGMSSRIRNGWDAMVFQIFYDWWRAIRELGEKASVFEKLPDDWLEKAMAGELQDESE